MKVSEQISSQDGLTLPKSSALKSLKQMSAQTFREMSPHLRRLTVFNFNENDGENQEDYNHMYDGEGGNYQNNYQDDNGFKMTPTPYPIHKKREAKAQKTRSKQKEKQLLQSGQNSEQMGVRTSSPVKRKHFITKVAPFIYVPNYKLTKDDKIVGWAGYNLESAKTSDLFQEDSNQDELGGQLMKINNKNLEIERLPDEIQDLSESIEEI